MHTTNSPNRKYSAGILPYSFHNGITYFLMGKDSREDCWSDFGGKCENKDNNNTAVTACREFYEETCGSVMSYDHGLYTLMNDGSDCQIIRSSTLNGSPYYMYLMYIPYLNYKQIFYKTMNLLKYIEYSNSRFREKCDIRWVDQTTLLNGSTSIKFRSVFRKTVTEGYTKLSNISQEACGKSV